MQVPAPFDLPGSLNPQGSNDGITVSAEHWPFLWVQFTGVVTVDHVQQWLLEMDKALERAVPYVMVMENGSLIDFPQEGKKNQVLWFKSHRDQVATYCRGIVRIARDRQQADKLLRPQVQKAFPCPLRVVYTVEEAFRTGAELLAGQSEETVAV